MNKLEEAINTIQNAIRRAECADACGAIIHKADLNKMLSLLKAQDEVITALRKVGYPHNFQGLQPWIVNYMYAITDVIKKAVKLE